MSNPEEEWWCGYIDNETGIFPRVYVEPIPEDEVLGMDSRSGSKASTPAMNSYKVSSPKNTKSSIDGDIPVLKEVQAIYDFKGADKDELSFTVGEVLKVYSETDGWYGGENLKGQRGIFPVIYVKDIS
uniref:SH3 domain-containing protein 19 n=1 Tax=Lygus hesperus TaxID=30085 RepID=A0A0A9Z3D7_LYGHE